MVAIQVLRIGRWNPFRDVVPGPRGGVYRLALCASELFVGFHLLRLPLRAFFILPQFCSTWLLAGKWSGFNPPWILLLDWRLFCYLRKTCTCISLWASYSSGMLRGCFISRCHVERAWALGFWKAVAGRVYHSEAASHCWRGAPIASTTPWLQVKSISNLEICKSEQKWGACSSCSGLLPKLLLDSS